MSQSINLLDGEKFEDIAGLCLSGGGYRAMLYHAGAICRMNRLGLLRRLRRVSSVSGGSMAAAALATSWPGLQWNAAGVATNLDALFLPKIYAQANDTVDVTAVIEWLLPFQSPLNDLLASYSRNITGNTRIADLPSGQDDPVFVFNATNLMTGGLFRMRRDYVADRRIGVFRGFDMPLALAVAASAAFPPFLSPIEIDLSTVVPDGSGATAICAGPPYTQKALLTDGGVYDNLGLETVWKRCRTIFLSDGGKPWAPDPSPPRGIEQLSGVVGVATGQCDALRKRMLFNTYQRRERLGAMWALDDGMDDGAPPPPGLTLEEVEVVSAISTRLCRFDLSQQNLLLKAGWLGADDRLSKFYPANANNYAAAPLQGWPQRQ
ncbi:MAG: patatin-like phospholipase family protein [Alphaproteobacteria bacterium]